MNEFFVIQILFFFVIILIVVLILITYFRKNNIEYDYDRIIKEMKEQTKDNIDILTKYNKKKDLLEKEIKKKRKLLNKKGRKNELNRCL